MTAGSGSHGSDRPVVAVVAYHLADDRVPRWPQGGYGVPAPYIDAVRRSGARTGIVSPGEPGPPEATLERYDGLLLVGGGDVDPARYGADRDAAHVYGVEPDRDDFELDLLPAAERLALPTLCICRGMQVMNVAYGGTLHQHLPDLPGLLEHGVPIEGTETRHPVALEPSSTLAAATRHTEIVCSSHHHQGIDRLGAGLRVAGRSPDGLVEANGRDTRGQGNASASIKAELVPTDAGGTHVTVLTDLSISGKVAQFGRGVMADVSNKLLDQFVQNLESTVLAAGAAPSEPTPSQPPASDATDAPPAAPQLRSIDGPDAATGPATADTSPTASAPPADAPADPPVRPSDEGDERGQRGAVN